MSPEIRQKEPKDKRKFARLPFGDSHTYHDIWESKQYKSVKKDGLLPSITEELVFPDGSNGEQTHATLKNGLIYQSNDRSIKFEGRTWWSIIVSFNGKVVREIRPVLPEEFYS